MLDAKVKLLADAPRPMKHNARVSFHSHVSETGARIRLLDARRLQPGKEAWAQIHLTNPLPLVKGDFFVVRDTETTIGGGKVVDPFPRRHRPFTKSVLNSLKAMDEGTLEEADSRCRRAVGALRPHRPRPAQQPHPSTTFAPSSKTSPKAAA